MQKFSPNEMKAFIKMMMMIMMMVMMMMMTM